MTLVVPEAPRSRLVYIVCTTPNPLNTKLLKNSSAFFFLMCVHPCLSPATQEEPLYNDIRLGKSDDMMSLSVGVSHVD